jgi:hypothetical protein
LGVPAIDPPIAKARTVETEAGIGFGMNMDSPTFPVFRRASVLAADRSASPQQSVEIARALKAGSAEFIDKLTGFLKSDPFQLSGVRPAVQPDSPGPRIRLDPAIIVDFPAIRFTWQTLQVETRVGMTTWITPRKAKLWTRFHLTDEVSDARTVRDFFSAMRTLSDRLHNFCIGYYSALTFETQKLKLKLYYQILIFAVSSPSLKLLEAVEAQSELRIPPNKNNLEKCLTKVLVDDFDIELPELGNKFKRSFNSFLFPIINPSIMSARRALLSDSHYTEIIHDTHAFDELQCITVTDTWNDHAEIWAVVYEEHLLPSHRQSGTFIVSAELSLMFGGLY